MLIRRNCVVRHKHHDICPAELHSPVSGISMIKLLLGQMVDLQIPNSLKAMVIPEGLFRIHHNDLSHWPGLTLQHFQKPGKFLSRLVGGDHHIHL